MPDAVHSRLKPVLRGLLRRRTVLLPLVMLIATAAVFAMSTSPGSASTATATGKKKFTVWYTTANPVETAYMTALTKEWAKSRGVDATFTPYDYDPFNRTFRLALSAHRGEPDVAYGDPTAPYQGAYTKANWIVDLTPYAKKYGWQDKIDPSVLNYYNNQCCAGKMTGVPLDVITVGFFYNQLVFAKYGLSVPRTFPQLQAAFAKLKASGVTPISVGGLTIQNPGTLNYVFALLVHALLPRSWIAKAVAGDEKLTWKDPRVVQALAYFQNWEKEGYFESDALATSGSDAAALFTNGSAAMTVDGTWSGSGYMQAAKFPVRFFPMPRINPNIPWVMAGYSPNNDWQVNAFSKNKDLAADYLDFMLSQKVGKTLWNNSDIPAIKLSPVPPPRSKLQGDVESAMKQTKTGFYLSAVAGGGYWSQQYKSALQQLIDGSLTPTQCAQQLQSIYQKALAGG